ncbi:MAG: hypothetical protein LC794_20530 [Acidobacteria bacterium]|nr:hypothetical protein [Acidobacteriota bacterium]
MKTIYIIALLLALVSGLTAQDQQPQTDKDKQPQTTKPEFIETGNYTEWRHGPDGFSARTGVTAPDGSSLTIYDYGYWSGNGIKELLQNCTKDAFNVIEDAKLPSTKGRAAGRRTLALFRDSERRESAVLCRSTGKRKLTMIHGTTVENVLGLERTSFPK